MKKWISIKDKKPKDGVMKLLFNMNATTMNCSVYVGWFAGGHEAFPPCSSGATHWMDLPNPPKMDEQS